MASGKSLKSLLGRRRRANDEGEEDEGSTVLEQSQSEGSVISDLEDEEADANGQDIDGHSVLDEFADPTQIQSQGAINGNGSTAKKLRKVKKKLPKKHGLDTTDGPAVQEDSFKVGADTTAMMNGLTIANDSRTREMLDFDDIQQTTSTPEITSNISAPSAAAPTEPNASRNRRDHDEYRKKRDADPAFIPTRGNFFMHDTRSANNRNAPVGRGAWNPRGRGRGTSLGGSFSPASQASYPPREAEQPWKHDLHDTINEEPGQSSSQPKPGDAPAGPPGIANQKAVATGSSHPRPPISFSHTTLVGKVQIRVSLPHMKAPIVFSEVPWKRYTRLPNHRPPLRRDKPVRVSISGHVQRYIFPSVDRSFIFIPRQMRPTQQGFGRGGGYQRSIGGYGYSSRRTSMYGGSVYANSVAASRRSSFASVARDSTFSPVGAYGPSMPPTRPIVRLPHGSQSNFSMPSTPMGPLSGHQTPTMQVHTYPLPQQPTYQGTPTTTMHQPRPQKAISVTGIESPAAALQQPTPGPQELQPFQNQLPPHMNDQSGYVNQQQAYYSARSQPFYPQQPAPLAGPLTGIPEQAIHAPAFQPPGMAYAQPTYYGAYPPQQYYPYAQPMNTYGAMPMYAPLQPGYMMPSGPAVPAQHPPPPTHPSQPQAPPPSEQPRTEVTPQSQSGMVAHESNGMVFYLPAAEAQQQLPHADAYQPAEGFVPAYAMPGLPPPTPAPDAAYYYARAPVAAAAGAQAGL